MPGDDGTRFLLSGFIEFLPYKLPKEQRARRLATDAAKSPLGLTGLGLVKDKDKARLRNAFLGSCDAKRGAAASAPISVTPRGIAKILQESWRFDAHQMVHRARWFAVRDS